MAKALGRRRKKKLKQLEEALEEDPAFTEQFEKKGEPQTASEKIIEQEKEAEHEEKQETGKTGLPLHTWHGLAWINYHMREDLDFKLKKFEIIETRYAVRDIAFAQPAGKQFSGNDYAIALLGDDKVKIYTPVINKSYIFDKSKIVKTWHLHKEKPIAEPRAIVSAPDEKEMSWLIGSYDGKVTYLRGKKLAGKETRITPHISSMARKDKTIAVGFEKTNHSSGTSLYAFERLRWGRFSMKELSNNLPLPWNVDGLAFSSNGLIIAAGGFASESLIINGQISGMKALTDIGVTDVSAFGKYVAMACDDNKLRVTDWNKPPLEVDYGTKVNAVDFSYDKKYLAVACDDCKVHIYEFH